MIIPDSLLNELISNPVFKPDTRAIFFLLQNPEPLSSDDIAGATGISRKGANRAIKRLTGAGLVIPGDFQAKRRTLNIPSLGQIESGEVTRTTGESSGIFAERLDRIESMIGILLDRPGAGSASAHIQDGQKVTGAAQDKVSPVNGQGVTDIGMTGIAQDIMSPVNGQGMTNIGMTGAAQDKMSPVNGQGVTIIGMTGAAQDKMSPVNGLGVTIIGMTGAAQDKVSPVNGQGVTIIGMSGTEQDKKGIVSDPIVTEPDDAITRARAAAALKAASFNKEKQSSFSSTCAPASIGEVFKGLFGVQVPSGFVDTAAVEVMVARKQAGKLDNVKSPLAYLSSLSGKVQSPIKPAPVIQTSVSPTPAQSQATPTLPPLPSGVDQPRLSHETMAQINEIWDAMSIEERKPFEATALLKFEKQVGRFKVPLHILARAVFNGEYCKAHQLAM
jgi:biotin operon repressor